jgi:hypothetical protein
MTEVSEQNLFPPSPPVELVRVDSLQLIHPNLLEIIHSESTPQAPQPPRQINLDSVKEKIIPGKFEYVKQKWEREMLINAWQAITQTETWDFVRQPIESFMMCDDHRISIIYRKMEELGYDGHSGFSFGCTMRAMQYIAQHGEEKYKETRGD